jgi:hypothetical protein
LEITLGWAHWKRLSPSPRRLQPPLGEGTHWIPEPATCIVAGRCNQALHPDFQEKTPAFRQHLEACMDRKPMKKSRIAIKPPAASPQEKVAIFGCKTVKRT